MPMIRSFFVFFLFWLWMAGVALAAGPFDGRWYFEEELLVQLLPPEYEQENDKQRLESLKEQFLSNTYMLIDTAQRKIEIVVFGEGKETDFFEIVEEGPGILRIKPLDDPQITVLRILDDGRLEMKVESGDYAMYFLRERSKGQNDEAQKNSR